MRYRSPLAHQALLHYLEPLPGKTPPSPAFDLGIITRPLKRHFQNRTLEESLGDLAILATRFDATYISTRKRIDWRSDFRTQVPRFKSLIADVTVKQLAIELTRSDKHDFDLLCLASLKRLDSTLIGLHSQWNAITVELEEICIAHPPLMRRLRELAEVSKL